MEHPPIFFYDEDDDAFVYNFLYLVEEDGRGTHNIVFSRSASCPFHFMNIAPNNKGEWALLLTISIVSFEKCI